MERLNCPLRMRCINSTPAIVVAALLNPLKPSITFVLDLMFRWSWSGSSSALLRCCYLRTVRAPLGGIRLNGEFVCVVIRDRYLTMSSAGTTRVQAQHQGR